VSLHVERFGRGADLVLLHGWAQHSGAWDEVMPSLAERYRVHAVDLPGHGHSSGVSPTTLDDAVDQVASAIPGAAIVCGWSLGGLVAQRLALLRPQRVRALVLASATPCFVERDDWRAAMKAETLQQFFDGLRVDCTSTLERFVRLNALNGARGREAMRAFSARLGSRGPPGVAALESALAWLRDTDLRGEVASIDAPAVVVHGSRDMLAPIEAGRWLAASLRRARLVELPDCAHVPFFTHRDAFVAAVHSIDG